MFKVGDKFYCTSIDKSWKGLNFTIGDIFELVETGLVHKLSLVGGPFSLSLYVNDNQMTLNFTKLLTQTILPPGSIQYVPPSIYSPGDILVLNQWNQSMPSYLSPGTKCTINRVTVQPFVLFDLVETSGLGRYVGSFSEDELNKWFIKQSVPSVNWRRVGHQMEFDMSFPDSYAQLKKKCDCGAEKTYGPNCNEFSHSTWCNTLRKEA